MELKSMVVATRVSVSLRNLEAWVKFHRASFTMLASMLLIALLALSFLIPHYGYVKELTVGGGVIADADKLRDIRVVPLLIVVQFLILSCLAILKIDFSDLLVGCFYLLAVTAAITVTLNTLSVASVALFASLVVAIWISRLASREHFQVSSARVILVAAGSTFALNHLFSSDPVYTFSLATVVTSGLLLRWKTLVERWLASAAGLIVILAFAFAAPTFWYGAAEDYHSAIDYIHFFLSAALVVGSLKWNLLKYHSSGTSYSCLTVAIAFGLLLSPTISSGVLPVDDYHFGEKLLAAQALFDGNRSWFIDFFSPHGLSDAFGAIFAWSVGDLTGTGVHAGESIVLLYPTILLSWLLIRRVGAISALGILIVFPLEDRSVLMLTLSLLLATEAACLRSPRVAGFISVIVIAAAVFINAGLGVAGGSVGYLAGLVVQVRRSKRSLIEYVTTSFFAIALLGVLFSRQILGQLNFIAVSAYTNLTIYGNGDINVAIFHLYAFVFAISPILALVMYHGLKHVEWASTHNKYPTSDIISLIIPIAAFSLVINSYASGRLDDTAPRALFATICIVTFLPTWVALLKGTPYATLSASWLSILLLLAVSPWPLNIRSDKPILPLIASSNSPFIYEEIPRLGRGASDSHHLEMIKEVKSVVDRILEPSETFLNLTNRNSLSFYLDRPISVPFPSPYNAAPEAFQKSVVTSLKQDPPPLALVAVDNIEHDGLSLSLRSPLIFKFLIENYVPFVVGTYTYGIRKDLDKRLRDLSQVDVLDGFDGGRYSLGSYSDDNWRNGIAIGLNASVWSFALPPDLSGRFVVGDKLLFSDGIVRTIERIDGTNVRTTPTAIGCLCDVDKEVSFKLVNRKLIPLPHSWAEVFHVENLGRIPSAWGRSYNLLSRSLSQVSQRLELQRTVDLTPTEDKSGEYRVAGVDPYWVYTLPQQIAPFDGGVLDLSINCSDRDVRPIVQVFWRSKEAEFSEYASVTFEASNDRNLVPLDSSLRWRTLPNISEIRIDLSNADACGIVMLEGVSLFQRR